MSCLKILRDSSEFAIASLIISDVEVILSLLRFQLGLLADFITVVIFIYVDLKYLKPESGTLSPVSLEFKTLSLRLAITTVSFYYQLE